MPPCGGRNKCDEIPCHTVRSLHRSEHSSPDPSFSVCSPAVSSFSHCPSQVFKTKLWRMCQGTPRKILIVSCSVCWRNLINWLSTYYWNLVKSYNKRSNILAFTYLFFSARDCLIYAKGAHLPTIAGPSLFMLLLLIIFICVYLYLWMYVHVWRTNDFEELMILSFYLSICSGDRTQVARFVGKHHYLLSHLVASFASFIIDFRVTYLNGTYLLALPWATSAVYGHYDNNF